MGTVEDERPLKKQRLTSVNDDLHSLRGEIDEIKETLRRIATQVAEGRQDMNVVLTEVQSWNRYVSTLLICYE